MGNMKDVALQVSEACGECVSKCCAICKITILQSDKRIVVNGYTKEIESVEFRKKGVCYV